MGVELLPSVFTAGWASGVNAYATVLALGLLSRVGGVEAIPAGLGRTWVLVIAAVLFSAEFVADKVPYFDSMWDSIHTFIRPVVGAGLGYLLTKDAGGYEAVFATLGGGATALASHGVKSFSRLGVNGSPEPFSNIAISSAEDVTVVGLIALAVAHPWLSASIALVLLLAGVLIVWLLLKRIKAFREHRRGRRIRGPELLRQRLSSSTHRDLPVIGEPASTPRRRRRWN
ncbi:DUF4126 family protein [Epidermidibacterium keratini]|uniref:DUF4126 family protein n=1 Tax=Epidermidibacterium keratini TaxID=1891644 RepID=A0A7L4YTR6_9ACTN|nr:DUF4126 domain-containing protein [Epidermidibacterium keratini]QHC02169.1 DUF4126 family protein [Epidermidibacterium keratini]